MSTNRTAFERAVERWNAGDLDGYLELYDDGLVFHGTPPRGKAETAAFYRGLWAAFPTPGFTSTR